MFNVVWSNRRFPNTGNVIRLCANTGARLHWSSRSASRSTMPACGAPGWTTTSTPRCACTRTGSPAHRRTAGPGPHVRADHQGLDALRPGSVRAGRLVRVRFGDARHGAGAARVVSARAAHPAADAPRQPQPEPVQHRRRGGVRGGGRTVSPAAPEFFRAAPGGNTGEAIRAARRPRGSPWPSAAFASMVRRRESGAVPAGAKYCARSLSRTSSLWRMATTSR